MDAPRELMAKLQVQSGKRLWLINAPLELAEELAAGAEVEMVHEQDEYDGVIAFFDSAAEVDQLAPRILAELPNDGLLWVSGSDENADAFTNSGWHPGETIQIGDGRSLQRFERR